jgi:hypothetical protein
VSRGREDSLATLRGGEGDDEVEWLGTQLKRARRGPAVGKEVVDVDVE